jgi:hypothetical protein
MDYEIHTRTSIVSKACFGLVYVMDNSVVLEEDFDENYEPKEEGNDKNTFKYKNYETMRTILA